MKERRKEEKKEDSQKVKGREKGIQAGREAKTKVKRGDDKKKTDKIQKNYTWEVLLVLTTTCLSQ